MPADFRSLLHAAGVSRPWLAERVGRSRELVDRWCAGRLTPPPAVVAWLERRISDPPPALPARLPRGS